MVLTVVDTSAIQAYIFGSNRLRENIGASFLVHQATTTWPYEVLKEAFQVRTNVVAGSSNELALEDRTIEPGEPDADVRLPQEGLLEYVRHHLSVVRQELRPVSMQFGKYAVPGVVGQVEWECDGESPPLLRLINALTDYAQYCGTGIQTSLGMGQTIRIKPGW